MKKQHELPKIFKCYRQHCNFSSNTKETVAEHVRMSKMNGRFLKPAHKMPVEYLNADPSCNL